MILQYPWKWWWALTLNHMLFSNFNCFIVLFNLIFRPCQILRCRTVSVFAVKDWSTMDYFSIPKYVFYLYDVLIVLRWSVPKGYYNHCVLNPQELFVRVCFTSIGLSWKTIIGSSASMMINMGYKSLFFEHVWKLSLTLTYSICVDQRRGVQKNTIQREIWEDCYYTCRRCDRLSE